MVQFGADGADIRFDTVGATKQQMQNAYDKFPRQSRFLLG